MKKDILFPTYLPIYEDDVWSSIKYSTMLQNSLLHSDRLLWQINELSNVEKFNDITLLGLLRGYITQMVVHIRHTSIIIFFIS